MEDNNENEGEMLLEVRKKSFVPHGPTTMSELASVRNLGNSCPFNLISTDNMLEPLLRKCKVTLMCAFDNRFLSHTNLGKKFQISCKIKSMTVYQYEFYYYVFHIM